MTMAMTRAMETPPHFFKVFLSSLCSQHLIIPPAFVKQLAETWKSFSRQVYLIGPHGVHWDVKLRRTSDGLLLFDQGWKEFVTNNCIDHGDLLVFCMDGPSCFSVTVFDKTACEKVPLLQNPTPSKLRGNEEVTPANLPIKVRSSRGRKRKAIQCEPETEYKGKQISTEFPTSDTRKIQKIIPTKKSGEESKSLAEDAGYKKPICVRNYTPRKTYPAPNGRRGTGFLSQRRPVTEEEKEGALQRAISFKSKLPFVLVVMRDTYVYSTFCMHIPCSFSKLYLPKGGQKMVLWDSNGVPWPVKYVCGSISQGWSAFAVAHNLEKYDVCVFELIRKDSMKVHIYRVVDEIVPLIRA